MVKFEKDTWNGSGASGFLQRERGRFLFINLHFFPFCYLTDVSIVLG